MTTSAMQLGAMPSVHASTLIRRPAAEVFAAFIDPAITTRFWFTKSSGALAPGATVLWGWEMYGVANTVVVEALEPVDRLVFVWSGDLTVEFRFVPLHEGTIVSVAESGFTGTADEAITYVGDSTGGFTTVLCGAKAVLEHGIELGAVRDKFPHAWV
jgi:uncharacterized protein YndB with AHSA1/START domain